MLPLPAIRLPRASSRTRSLLKRIDDYTLWAFNPQPPYAPYRDTVRDADRSR